RFASVHELIAALGGESLVTQAPALGADVGADAAAAAEPASEMPELAGAAPGPNVRPTMRRRGLRPWAMLLMLAAFTWFLRARDDQRPRVLRPDRSPTVAIEAGRPSRQTTVRDEIRRLSGQVEQLARRRGGNVELKPLDERKVALPSDLPMYR